MQNGIGGVLSQLDGEKEVTSGFAFKRLKEVETCYSVIEKEMRGCGKT